MSMIAKILLAITKFLNSTVATLAFEANGYTIMEAVGTLMPNILVLDSTLPQEANITVNVSTISGSARSESL